MQGMDASGKYVRYTNEQVEALERVYHECPKPSSIRRQQLIKDCPILANIEPKQIKVWFQNRRCREKQRKEATRLVSVNAKLTALNKLLMEENERLAKHTSQLTVDNHFLRKQLQQSPPIPGSKRPPDQAAVGSTDTSSDSVVTVGLPPQPTPQHSPRGTSPAGLVLKCPVPLRLFSRGMSITVFIAIPVSFLVFNISCCFCWWSCKCFWLTLGIRNS